MAAHKKYATKIIFHLRNQSIAIFHIPYPMSMSYPTAALAQDVVRVCQRWGHADKIQSLWIYAPLQEMKRKKCAKCIDTPTPTPLSLSLLSVGVVCLSVCLPGMWGSLQLPVIARAIHKTNWYCLLLHTSNANAPVEPQNGKRLPQLTPFLPPLRC